jgi:hypothetical protein
MLQKVSFTDRLIHKDKHACCAPSKESVDAVIMKLMKDDLGDDFSQDELKELTDRYKSMTNIPHKSLSKTSFNKLNSINKLIAACSQLQEASCEDG